jgi:lipoprotein-releasing system permease protein
MLETRIARRYLWTARKEAHTAFLSLISMLGLAVGVATLLISIALLSGLQGQIKERLIEASPQLLVEPAGRNTIEQAGAIVAAAKGLGFSDVRPYVSGIAWGANEEQRTGRPMRVRSWAPGHEPQTDSEGQGEGGVWGADDREIFVTRGFAASLSLRAGDDLVTVAPRTRLTPFGPVPVMRRFRVARIVMPSSAEENVDAWLDLDQAAALFGTEGKPTAIEMYGAPELAEPVQAGLQQRFPGAQFKTWKEINKPLFLALRLVIFVAALNLVSSLSMLILEKRPSVGVLRTLGATERTILTLFLQLGLFIGLTGTVLGNAIGLGFSWAANRWHLVPLPADIYFISYLPFSLDVADVVGVNLVAVFLSVVATWYPARVASRLDPIQAIREE